MANVDSDVGSGKFLTVPSASSAEGLEGCDDDLKA